MKDHATSIEMSEKLKEAGIEIKNSQFYHIPRTKDEYKIYHISKIDVLIQGSFPALLATELLEILPYELPYNGSMLKLNIVKLKDGYDVGYIGLEFTWHIAKTLADSLAEMILYLKKNNLLNDK